MRPTGGDLGLGQLLGEGSLYGEVFWVGCGWFFLGGWGGEEETPGHVHQGHFSLDDTRFQTAPSYLTLCI